ncbi:unnamed protein product [marine sediment metagenome]|uniref:Uncharacterized protein n=1 Tax=marine sediment metagenome TaxID=412755 RepID=X1C6I1_9ZZZZ
MYRKCDSCGGIFKLPSKICRILIEGNNNIYCPYCESISSHVYFKQYDTEIVSSKRGVIY